MTPPEQPGREFGRLVEGFDTLGKLIAKLEVKIDVNGNTGKNVMVKMESLAKEVSGMAVQDERIERIKDEVKDIRDTMRWLTRLIIGAVFLALLGLVVGAKNGIL